jgi:hypothetical protein
MSPLTKNYQYYEGKIDKRIGLDFTKGKEYNVDAVNNWYKMLPFNQKLKIEWGRVISMVICFEITYGRYLKILHQCLKKLMRMIKFLYLEKKLQ